MPPPFNITGAPNADWIIFIVGAVISLYWLRAQLAREGARMFLRNLLKAAMVFCALMSMLTGFRSQTHLLPSQEQIIAGFVALISFGKWQSKKRSRYISKATRRAVIERGLKGEEFDPQKHHIDHVWPFSKGGSHTTDNLRVIEKKKNLQKGAKRPRLREMWQ
ncbi:MAG: HNH endonuclease [Bryobacteraceae bacterium]|jgi:hypothetical protein